MAEYVLPVGTKVKTTKKMRVFAMGVGEINLPKGTKGVIDWVDKNSNACYRVRLTGLNADAWFRPHQIQKTLW